MRYAKKADWYGDRFKEQEIAFAIAGKTKGYDGDRCRVMELVKAQQEYH